MICQEHQAREESSSIKYMRADVTRLPVRGYRIDLSKYSYPTFRIWTILIFMIGQWLNHLWRMCYPPVPKSFRFNTLYILCLEYFPRTYIYITNANTILANVYSRCRSVTGISLAWAMLVVWWWRPPRQMEIRDVGAAETTPLPFQFAPVAVANSSMRNLVGGSRRVRDAPRVN